MTGNDQEYYIDKTIEAIDKADRLYKEFWAAYASIRDDWPRSVGMDHAEYNTQKYSLAQIAGHLDTLQSRLLLEKHRASQRASSQSDY